MTHKNHKKGTSENKLAEQVVGFRQIMDIEGMIVPLDMPSDLGYKCPKKKTHPLEWSEYNGFIWCAVCNKNMPSCICQPDINEAIKTYLLCIKEAQKN